MDEEKLSTDAEDVIKIDNESKISSNGRNITSNMNLPQEKTANKLEVEEDLIMLSKSTGDDNNRAGQQEEASTSISTTISTTSSPSSGIIAEITTTNDVVDSDDIGSTSSSIDQAKRPLLLKDDLRSEDRFNCFPTFEEAKEQAVHLAERIWECAHFRTLPEWLQDNDFLHHGHRPQLPSFSACIRSVFRIHTETGNIWSHMLGCLLFLIITAYIYTRPHHEVHLEKKFVFMPFLLGAVVCMAFSSAFHTMYCHSERINRLFLKLDYVGISLLIMGSFIPWLYYTFYCRIEPKVVYISLILFLGTVCIWVSFCETFSAPNYRHLRAGVFITFGCCGVIPCIHYFITEGFYAAFTESAFGWLILMALIYLCGALLYAFRVPERFFPGKCDIWFQSHQLFHLLVVVAAFINYHGIQVLSVSRLNGKYCEELEKANWCDILPGGGADQSSLHSAFRQEL